MPTVSIERSIVDEVCPASTTLHPRDALGVLHLGNMPLRDEQIIVPCPDEFDPLPTVIRLTGTRGSIVEAVLRDVLSHD
jgi:hypothetical protein